jgi:mannose-1-phosphate guanylyltransferase
MATFYDKPGRCGVVLAGGDGSRVRPFVERLRGKALPKQYVNFVGTRSMLEHTLSRAKKLIAPERLFTVVNEAHLRLPEARRQLSQLAEGTLIVQPRNNDTGLGIALALLRVRKRYPNATVAIFPSDHFVLQESLFMAHVDLALRVVERRPGLIVLLGVKPDRAETEYGYISLGSRVKDLSPPGIHEITRFSEKPDMAASAKLVLEGALWNTMVMAFAAKAVLDLFAEIIPRVKSYFERISSAIGTSRESQVIEEAYAQLGPINFSRDLIEPLASKRRERLVVLPVTGVFWSDWGSEERIEACLERRIGAPADVESEDRAPVAPRDEGFGNFAIDLARREFGLEKEL